jgi:hypothetical protein
VVLTLIVLAALFVGLDRAAAWGAGRAAERSLADAERVDAEVSFAGFPFLTQVTSGDLERVDVRVASIDVADGVRVDDLTARLSGVRVTRAAITEGDLDGALVEAAIATGRISLASVEAAIATGMPDQLTDVGVSLAGDEKLQVSATYTGIGGPAPVQAEVGVSVDGGRLVVDVPPSSVTPRIPQVRRLVTRWLEAGLDLPDLPFGFEPTRVSVDADGLLLRARADRLTL